MNAPHAPSPPAARSRRRAANTRARRHDPVTSPATPLILFDAHAHYYPCFDAHRFLTAAARNFTRGAATLGADDHPPGYLALAATASCNGLAALLDLAARGRAGPWRIEPTPESVSFTALLDGVPHLVLIASHQAATAEGLELLAIGTTTPIPDGLPLLHAADLARSAGALAVIPWGFGKWWRRRAAVLMDFLASEAAKDVCLGDSAARPYPALPPVHFRLAARRGIPILPGTDPLPISSSATLAGSYGLALRARHDPARPFAVLRRALDDSRPGAARVYGSRCGLIAALRAQIALRCARRTEEARA